MGGARADWLRRHDADDLRGGPGAEGGEGSEPGSGEKLMLSALKDLSASISRGLRRSVASEDDSTRIAEGTLVAASRA